MFFLSGYETLIIILLILSIIFLIVCLIDKDNKNKTAKYEQNDELNKQNSYNYSLFDDENINNMF